MMDNDTISRQVAIEKIEDINTTMSVCLTSDECKGMKRMKERCIEVIKELSGKHKIGRWIPFDCDTWECSECKNLFTTLEGTPKDNLFNFCPNCGQALDWSDKT